MRSVASPGRRLSFRTTAALTAACCLATALAPAGAAAQRARGRSATRANPVAAGDPLAAGSRADGRQIPFLYKNASLEQIIGDYSRESGERFLLDERARKRVTIAMKRSVSLPEARALIDAALLYVGLALLPGPADVWKLVDAQTPPAVAPLNQQPGERAFAPAITIAEVQHAPLPAVLAVVRSLIGADSLAIELGDDHSLLLASNEAQLHRLLGIIDALDQGATADVLVRRLRYANAVDSETTVREAMGLDDPFRPDTGFMLLADARLNALLAVGRRSELDEARKIIEQIDVRLEGQGEIEVVRLQHRDAEEIAERLHAALQSAPGSGADPDEAIPGAHTLQIAVDVPTRSLLLRGTPDTLRAVRNLIEELDRPTPQVLVEFTVLEIDSVDSLVLGTAALGGAILGGTALVIESLTAGGLISQAGSGLRVAEFRDPLPTRFGTDATGAPLASRFQVIANATDTKAQILQRPRLLAASGERHRFTVGANIPIPVQASTDTTTTNTRPLQLRTNIERQDIGIEIAITPTLGTQGGVDLEIEIDVTDVLPENPRAIGAIEDVGPTLIQRRLNSRLWLPDGGTSLLGSAPQTSYTDSGTGVPFLQDIPLLGHLFKTRSRTPTQQTIVFAVQAWIQRSQEDRLADSLRLRLGFERALDRTPLSSSTPGPAFGVRVATVEREDDAVAVRDSLPPEFAGAQIEAWGFYGERLWDVVLTDYESIADAAGAAAALSQLGWRAEFIAIPNKSARLAQPGFD